MIGTVNLNAAIDQFYLVPRLKSGSVNRVTESRAAAGGKGMNVARVISQCGYSAAAAGFRGGASGEVIRRELERLGIRDFYTDTGLECRRCLNVKDASDGSQTELLEPGPQIPLQLQEQFLQDFDHMAVLCQVLTFSGSAPSGVEKDVYKKLVLRAKAAGRPVLLDASGELLRYGLEGGPALAKPNREELFQLLGEEVEQQKLPRALEQLRSRYGVGIMTVSLGAQGVMAADGTQTLLAAPPKDLPVVNTVGCGDSMMAAFAIGLHEGFSLEETLRYGVAVSAANALTEQTGSCDPQTVRELLPAVEVFPV